MSKVWEFAVSTKQAVIIVGCLSLAVLFFSAAGFAIGLIVAARQPEAIAAARHEIPQIPKLASVVPAKAPEPEKSQKETEASTQRTPQPAVAPTAATPVSGADKGGITAVAAAAPLPIRIAIQVGSFSLEDNALDVLERLKRYGYPASTFSTTDARNRRWHVVQVGPYADYDNASRIAMELSGKYGISPRLVTQTNF